MTTPEEEFEKWLRTKFSPIHLRLLKHFNGDVLAKDAYLQGRQDEAEKMKREMEEWQNKYLEAGEIIQHLRMEIFELKQLKEGKG